MLPADPTNRWNGCLSHCEPVVGLNWATKEPINVYRWISIESMDPTWFEACLSGPAPSFIDQAGMPVAARSAWVPELHHQLQTLSWNGLKWSSAHPSRVDWLFHWHLRGYCQYQSNNQWTSSGWYILSSQAILRKAFKKSTRRVAEPSSTSMSAVSLQGWVIHQFIYCFQPIPKCFYEKLWFRQVLLSPLVHKWP